MKVSDDIFDSMVQKALDRIPGEIRRYLDNIVISVRKRPSKQMLRTLGLAAPGNLLGLFQGVPLVDRSATSPPLYPDTIILFQEPLENVCSSADEMEEQIEITVVHEVAHFVGMSDEQLRELGYG